MAIAYDKLVPSLKNLLPAPTLDLLGRTIAFIRRLRELRASLFVWSVVLSRFSTGRPGFEEARRWYERLGGGRLFPRPFQMRFKSEAAVSLFEGAFAHAVDLWRDPQPRRPRHLLARKFADIVAIDTSWLQVDDELRPVFKGTHGMKAALKALLAVSVFGLVPLYGQLVAANVHDATLFPPLALFQAATLLLFDKGFVAYDRLRQIQQAGLLYLCPMRQDGNALVVGVRRAPARVRKALRTNPQGVWLRTLLPAGKPLRQVWDLDVEVRPKRALDRTRVPTRLVLVPGPRRKQYPYLTNLSPAQWSPAALRELYRLRWQVELVWKELKQHLNLETLPSKDPCAVQCFAWASLLGLALSRTVTAWLYPLARLVGLAAKIRPLLLTRALRATLRFLARALLRPPRQALPLLIDFADEILLEVRTLQPQREDSFQRLIPLLAVGGSP